jgi:hypothetical protein
MNRQFQENAQYQLLGANSLSMEIKKHVLRKDFMIRKSMRNCENFKGKLKMKHNIYKYVKIARDGKIHVQNRRIYSKYFFQNPHGNISPPIRQAQLAQTG